MPRIAAQDEGKGGGREQDNSKCGGVQDWDPGTVFLAVLRAWGKSLLVSASSIFCEVNYNLIAAEARGCCRTHEDSSVDPICEDK